MTTQHNTAPHTYLTHALRFHKLGANTLPIGNRKQPIINWENWQLERQDEAFVRSVDWRGTHGVGVVSGVSDWRCVDFDWFKDEDTKEPLDGEVPWGIIDTFLKLLGLPADYRWVVKSGSGKGYQIYFKCPDALPGGLFPPQLNKKTGEMVPVSTPWGWPVGSTKDKFDHIELRWHSCQTVVPPSLHPSGGRYKWVGEEPDCPPTEVPVGSVLAAFFGIAKLKEEKRAAEPERKRREPVAQSEGDTDLRQVIEEVKSHIDLAGFAQHLLGGGIQDASRGEVRVLGHGGLLVKPEDGVWNNRSENVGGDAIDLALYYLQGRHFSRDGKPFIDALKLACEFAGVTFPERPDGFVGNSGGFVEVLSGELPTKTTASGSGAAPLEDGAEGFIGFIGEFGKLVDLANPELPTFPVEMLPTIQAEYVKQWANFTQTPVDLTAMLLLAVTSATCARRIGVRIKKGYEEQLNIWTLGVAVPGERKSAIVKELVEPFVEFEKQERIRLAPEVAAAKTQIDIKTSRLEALKKQAATAKAGEEQGAIREAEKLAVELATMKMPAAHRLLTTDATPETLGTLMSKNGGRMAVIDAEGGLFGTLAGRYSRGEPNLDLLLKSFSGDDVFIDRKDKEECISRPACTLGLLVQPSVLSDAATRPGFLGRGLMSRWLYTIPKSAVGFRDTDPAPVDEGLRMVARETTMQLLRLGASIDTEGQEFLVFSDEARRSFDAFAKWLEPQLAPGQPLSSTYGWGSKLVGQVARIAGVLHLMDTVGHDAPWEEPLTSDVVERAIVIGRYLIGHALAAFGVMKANPDMENIKHVVEWIKTKQIKEFGRPDAHNALEHHFKTVADLEPTLDLLEEYGYIIKLPAPPRPKGKGGRPPAPRYAVNPEAHS